MNVICKFNLGPGLNFETKFEFKPRVGLISGGLKYEYSRQQYYIKERVKPVIVMAHTPTPIIEDIQYRPLYMGGVLVKVHTYYCHSYMHCAVITWNAVIDGAQIIRKHNAAHTRIQQKWSALTQSPPGNAVTVHKGHSSQGPQFTRATVHKGHSSQGPQFTRATVHKGHSSQGSQFTRATVHKGHSSQGSQFTRVTVHKGHSSQGPHKGHSSQGSQFTRATVHKGHSSQGPHKGHSSQGPQFTKATVHKGHSSQGPQFTRVTVHKGHSDPQRAQWSSGRASRS